MQRAFFPSHLPGAVAALASILLLTSASEAQVAARPPVGGTRPATTYYHPAPAARPAPAPATYPQQTTYAQPYTQPAGDPYGFLGWLNATRASYGLRPVGYDPNLESWAAANNAQQLARGLGHHVMGGYRQNCAMGSAGSIGSMWMNSPAHRATLLDPNITAIGLAGAGQYWTLNAR